MSTIDPSTPLAAAIRARFDAQVHRAQTKERKAAPADPTREIVRAGAPRTAQQSVALRAISQDDPERQRKACKLFMTAVLIEAFGNRRLDEPGFDQLAEIVLQRMEADPGLRTSLKGAADILLGDVRC